MTRVAVIGGAGFYGSVVCEHVARVADVEVVVAARRPPPGGLTLDLKNPETFAALDSFDWVINCADSVLAPPDRAIAYCQEHAIGWIDMGAEAHATRRLLELDAPAAPLIIGAGVFPGMSTCLAHHLATCVDQVEALHLGVRISPLSGAGPANCELMTHTLEAPSLQVQGGALREGPALYGSRKLPYTKIASTIYLDCGLPDAPLLAHATDIPEITTSMAVAPAFLRHNFRILAALTRWAGPLRPLMRWMTRWMLRLSRGLFLRNVGSPVHLTAQAIADDGTHLAMLAFPEGREATALGVASVLSAALAADLAPGIYTAADVAPLPQLLERARSLRASDRPGDLELIVE